MGKFVKKNALKILIVKAMRFVLMGNVSLAVLVMITARKEKLVEMANAWDHAGLDQTRVDQDITATSIIKSAMKNVQLTPTAWKGTNVMKVNASEIVIFQVNAQKVNTVTSKLSHLFLKRKVNLYDILWIH